MCRVLSTSHNKQSLEDWKEIQEGTHAYVSQLATKLDENKTTPFIDSFVNFSRWSLNIESSRQIHLATLQADGAINDMQTGKATFQK